MSKITFKGGIHPPDFKQATCDSPVEFFKGSDAVYISMSQHIGAPASVLVKVGDPVKVGQKIGEAAGFVSCNVHSSVSGTVKRIVKMPGPSGIACDTVVIENDHLHTIDPQISPHSSLQNLSPEDIIKIIQEAGIVGMGGATFPTHVKLMPPKDKKIDVLIINAAECEPYLTCDHRLMMERPEQILTGTRFLMKALGVEKAFIGIEENKPDCMVALGSCLKEDRAIEIVKLHTKYPQGAEKQLIVACTGREVPSGALPMDVGVVVNNAATAAQVAKTMLTGLPLIERICTVTGGAIAQPKNVEYPIGVLYQDLIDFCGGFKEEPAKVISGGPMMGIAQPSVQIPTNKGSSGVLCFTVQEAFPKREAHCIRCSKCVHICPVNLEPLYISAYSVAGDFKKAEQFHALDCIECGSCSFICPSAKPLLPSIRVAKREIMSQRRKQSK